MLNFIILTPFTHQLYCLVTGQYERPEWQIFLDYLFHFGFDSGKIAVRESGISEVEVIVKSLFIGGTVGKLRLRV